MGFSRKGKLLVFAYVEVMGHRVLVCVCFYGFGGCLKPCRTRSFQLPLWPGT